MVKTTGLGFKQTCVGILALLLTNMILSKFYHWASVSYKMGIITPASKCFNKNEWWLINKALLSMVLDTRSGACSLWILGETGKHYCCVSAGGNDRVVIEKVMKSLLLVSDTVTLTLLQRFLLACVSFALSLCHQEADVTAPSGRVTPIWKETHTWVLRFVSPTLTPHPGWGTCTDGVCVSELPDSWLSHGGRRGVLVLDSGLAAGDFSLLGPQA